MKGMVWGIVMRWGLETVPQLAFFAGRKMSEVVLTCGISLDLRPKKEWKKMATFYLAPGQCSHLVPPSHTISPPTEGNNSIDINFGEKRENRRQQTREDKLVHRRGGKQRRL
ncbi:hypothetical protein WR25_01895 [Diploscapter pachys]|uniref:Uncharacterized protein n=1 Tax=Diploscapter pachys TaxID=2018661 RepID=A0A2A2KYD4_9BILA|nr:hypothetical protein WR25_01895 [Diploscapter pachys]